jgi:hypothetical protein
VRGAGPESVDGSLGIEQAHAVLVVQSTHVYEHGPADKDWVKLSNYLIACVKPVNLATTTGGFSTGNRRVGSRLLTKPSEEGAWTTDQDDRKERSQLRYSAGGYVKSTALRGA